MKRLRIGAAELLRWAHGLSTVPRALFKWPKIWPGSKEGRFDELAAIGEQLQELRVVVETLNGKYDRDTKRRRRQLKESTKRLHLMIVRREYRGLCPCCCNDRKNRVLDDVGEKVAGAEFDHAKHHYDVRPKVTWLVCGECNDELVNPECRERRLREWDAYQWKLARYMESDRGLFDDFI